jgi:hypothetical protein
MIIITTNNSTPVSPGDRKKEKLNNPVTSSLVLTSTLPIFLYEISVLPVVGCLVLGKQHH